MALVNSNVIQRKERFGTGEGSEAAEGKIKGDGADHPQPPVCTSGFTCTWAGTPCAGERGQVSAVVRENMVQTVSVAWNGFKRTHV